MRMLFLCLIFLTSISFAQDYDKSTAAFKKTLAELIKADTTSPPGNEKKATDILGVRLKEEGIEFQTMEFAPGRTNLVARLKGNGEKKPLLLLAHTDVVGTQNQDWSTPPHEMTEKDGFYYGRGTVDDLGMAVANLETFLNLKRQKVALKRDVILAFTGDEESLGTGIQKLLEVHPEWIESEIALNEGGRIVTDDKGVPRFVNLNVAEKTYRDFQLFVKGTTGHSSIPKGDNAIYLMAAALDRLAKYKPKERLLPAVREYFNKRAEFERPEVAKAMREIVAAKGTLPRKALDVLLKIPAMGPQFFTTCVATTITGGIRANALPPDATANVNCRIMPDEPSANVQKRLEQIINDPRVTVKALQDEPTAKGSALTGVVPDAVKKITKEMYPGIPVITAMVPGATDSRFLRLRDVQAYGLSPMESPESDAGRSHGVDERTPIASIRKGLEYQYRLVVELATQ